MPNRKASAVWEGGLKGGKGTFKNSSGSISGNYSFGSRFEEGPGSNPEELLAAADAIVDRIREELDAAVAEAEASPMPEPSTAALGVYAGSVAAPVYTGER